MTKRTTVDLTESAQLIKEQLVKAFGLKNILSAGLLLLNKLTTLDVSRVVSEVNEDLVEFDPYVDRWKLFKVSQFLTEATHYIDHGNWDKAKDFMLRADKEIGELETPIVSLWYVDTFKPLEQKLKQLISISTDAGEDNKQLLCDLQQLLDAEQTAAAGGHSGNYVVILSPEEQELVNRFRSDRAKEQEAAALVAGGPPAPARDKRQKPGHKHKAG
jgi:hypothetical protein